ncbi:12818_t:CDS:2 [Rhizophagus irregularis]|nr:12818_t:CDS:2 [Rhizophagus irregularis]
MGTMVQIGSGAHESDVTLTAADQDQVQVGLAEALDTIERMVIDMSIRGICKLVEFGIVIGNNYVCCYNGTKIETCKKRSMAINKRDTVHEEVDNILSAESEYDPVFKNEEKFKEALAKSRVKEMRENNLSINLKLYSMV